MRAPLPTALLIAATLALAGAAPALADTGQSSNWSGYAVHRQGVKFTRVSAAWMQPEVSCRRHRRTYSAAWVGIGGFQPASRALEQVGTEADCTRSGKAISSAWYELVPAASQPVRMLIRAGDTIAASVTVIGHTATLALENVSRHTVFKKTLHAQAVDTSSAEWIVEAPSECINANACQTLPLADFGSTTFVMAQAQSSAGHVGPIAAPNWDTTKIRLTPGGRRFVVYRGAGAAAGAARPSSLAAHGSSFTVRFARASAQGNPAFSKRHSAWRASYLVHRHRWAVGLINGN